MVSNAIHQHLVLPNRFINSSCALTKVDARFITSLLVRTRRCGLEFEELRVPLTEILAPSRRKLSSKDYTISLVALQARLTNLKLRPESSFADVGQCKELGLPLLSYVRYEKQKGWLRVRLAEELRPDFKQPSNAYTSAPYSQIIKLESTLAYRLYWLLRERANLGTRTLELAQLAWMLNLPPHGFNPSLFCMRQLKAAQRQLAATDLAFTAELEYARQKSRLHAIHFHFTPLNSVRPLGLLLDTASKLSSAALFGTEGESSFLQGLLIVFRYIMGGACIVAAATIGVG
jgi:hypothetical protein